jgi:hypothetical protein
MVTSYIELDENSPFIATSLENAIKAIKDRDFSIQLVPYEKKTKTSVLAAATYDSKLLFKHYNNSMKEKYNIYQPRDNDYKDADKDKKKLFVLKNNIENTDIVNVNDSIKLWEKLGKKIPYSNIPTPLPKSGLTDVHAGYIEDVIANDANVSEFLREKYGNRWQLKGGNLIINVDNSTQTQSVFFNFEIDVFLPISKKAAFVYFDYKFIEADRKFIEMNTESNDGEIHMTKLVNEKLLQNRNVLCFDGTLYFVVLKKNLVYEKRPQIYPSSNIELDCIQQDYNHPRIISRTRNAEIQQPYFFKNNSSRQTDVIGALFCLPGSFSSTYNENFMFIAPNFWPDYLPYVKEKYNVICSGHQKRRVVPFKVPKEDDSKNEDYKDDYDNSNLGNFDGIATNMYDHVGNRFFNIDDRYRNNEVILYRRGYYSSFDLSFAKKKTFSLGLLIKQREYMSEKIPKFISCDEKFKKDNKIMKKILDDPKKYLQLDYVITTDIYKRTNDKLKIKIRQTITQLKDDNLKHLKIGDIIIATPNYIIFQIVQKKRLISMFIDFTQIDAIYNYQFPLKIYPENSLKIDDDDNGSFIINIRVESLDKYLYNRLSKNEVDVIVKKITDLLESLKTRKISYEHFNLRCIMINKDTKNLSLIYPDYNIFIPLFNNYILIRSLYNETKLQKENSSYLDNIKNLIKEECKWNGGKITDSRVYLKTLREKYNVERREKFQKQKLYNEWKEEEEKHQEQIEEEKHQELEEEE